MTTYGGLGGHGTGFELIHNPDGAWSEKVLQDIDVDDYARFVYGLVFDQQGNVYGTISNGGEFGGGVVFELSPTSSGPWTQKFFITFITTPIIPAASSPSAA